MVVGKLEQTVFLASSGSACAGDGGGAVVGLGSGVSRVDGGDEDMMDGERMGGFWECTRDG